MTCAYCKGDGSRLLPGIIYETALVKCPGCDTEYTLKQERATEPEWTAPLNCPAGQHCQDMQECLGWCKPLVRIEP